MTDFSLVILVISTLFAALAALANLFQARKAAQTNEVNVYLTMMKDYGSTEMRGAISALAAFRRSSLDKSLSVSEAYAAEFEARPEAASALRGHCRLLSLYFVNVTRLHEAGFISTRLLKLPIAHPGLNVFYEVATPIALVKNKHDNAGRYATYLKKYVRQHGNGIY